MSFDPILISDVLIRFRSIREYYDWPLLCVGSMEMRRRGLDTSIIPASDMVRLEAESLNDKQFKSAHETAMAYLVSLSAF